MSSIYFANLEKQVMRPNFPKPVTSGGVFALKVTFNVRRKENVKHINNMAAGLPMVVHNFTLSHLEAFLPDILFY